MNLHNVKIIENQFLLTIVASTYHRCWINIRALVHHNAVNLDSQVSLVFVLDSLGFHDRFNTADLTRQTVTRHSLEVSTLAQSLRLQFLMNGDTNV